jgi:hypothetical protein
MSIFFYDRNIKNYKNFIYRIIIILLIIYYSIKVIALTFDAFNDPDAGWGILHLVNLIFHEAGHLIFAFFGDFITSLGGTLMQLIIPMLCMITLFIKTNDPFGGSICFWWVGENFLDISIYMNDAERMWLPLLGGRFGYSSPYGTHDWNYILNELGVLEYCQIFAKLIFCMGVFIMLLSIIWAIFLLLNQYLVIKKHS